jgi:predicted TIM-barrel fold metal-dependent hydrolase
MLALDCNTSFGVRSDERTDSAAATLAEQLATHGVAGALTLSLRGVLYDHRLGNEETLRVCAAHPGLIPAATINLARYVGWEEDVDGCLARGFRAFRLFPDDQHWTVADTAFERLCAHVAPSHVPLLFTIGTGTQAREIAARTADFGLPVILLMGSYANEAETIQLTRRYVHVHLDVARRATPHIVRYLVEECGIDRVLFGTNAPQNEVQPALNVVFDADLPPEQTEQILSGNLLRLLGMAHPASVGPLAVEPDFRGYAGPTIDVHAHLGPWRFPILTRATDTMLDYARRYHLEKIVVSSALGIVYDMREGNRELKALIDPHPELLGYVVTNPNFVEESAAELDAYYRHPNFIGAKIHGEYSRTPTAAPRMAALFAEIARRGRPVKIHNAGPDWLPALRELARRHRNLPIIVAHGGGWGTGPFLKDEPNVYLEYCGSSATRGLIREGLATLGPDRLLFGTDQDLLEPAYILGKYHDAGFSPQEAEKVMYLNAKRLFRL